MARDPRQPRRGRPAALIVLLALACVAPTAPVSAEPRALARALLDGGHVIYFRHAATDWSQHDRVTGAGDWISCDPGEMRQLSAAGRESSRAVGRAMRRLGIPVAGVHSSPYCRCVETAELLDLGPVATTLDLLNARSAESVGGREALRERARRRLGRRPPAGANTVLVAHGNVFLLAAGERPPEGGAAIVRPLGDGDFELLGTIPAATWPGLVGD